MKFLPATYKRKACEPLLILVAPTNWNLSLSKSPVVFDDYTQRNIIKRRSSCQLVSRDDTHVIEHHENVTKRRWGVTKLPAAFDMRRVLPCSYTNRTEKWGIPVNNHHKAYNMIK